MPPLTRFLIIPTPFNWILLSINAESGRYFTPVIHKYKMRIFLWKNLMDKRVARWPIPPVFNRSRLKHGTKISISRLWLSTVSKPERLIQKGLPVILTLTYQA